MHHSAYPEYRSANAKWLGAVPSHWDTKRLKMAVRLRDRKIEADPDEPLPYIGLENIESWTGRLLPIDDSVIPAGTANAFERTHTLFGKLRPYLAKACTPEFDGLCSTELLVLQSAELDRRSLLYSLLSNGFIELVNSSTFGSKMPRANWEFIGNCIVPIPPPNEQRAIADFLDRETARLDTLVGKKRELIEKLKEKRTALISRTVTRGLNPNVKLEPSGIEWLGNIPEHWELLPLTKYVAEKSDYRGKTPEKVADGVFLVTAKNVRMGWIDYEASQEFVLEEDYAEIMRRGLPKGGDILFTTEAPLGNVALVDREDVALAQRIIRFRVQPKRFVAQFALYGMMSDHFQIQLKSLATGSTAEGIKASKLHQLKLLAPPTHEQVAMVDYLDRQTAKLDRMMEKVEAAIEKLQEYRTALITAAVTGKIDVRNQAPQSSASY